MKKIILIAFLTLTALAANAQKVNWVTFEEAIAASEESPKPILVDLYTDWCGWCKRMDTDTYADKEIASYINENFYAVKFNGEGKGDVSYNGKLFKYVEYKKQNGRTGRYHEFAAAILKGRMSYPSTAFFNKNQDFVRAQGGYMPAEKFQKFIAQYTDK